MINGARHLNNNGQVLGLNVFDLVGAVGVLSVASVALQPVGLDFLCIPAGVAALVAVIPVRLRYRRRIIRDSLGFYLGSRIVNDYKRCKKDQKKEISHAGSR